MKQYKKVVEKAVTALPSVCPDSEIRSLHHVLGTATCFTTVAKISCKTFSRPISSSKIQPFPNLFSAF